MNGYQISDLKEFLPFLDETRYIYIFFIIIFIIIFSVLSIVFKSASKKSKVESQRINQV